MADLQKLQEYAIGMTLLYVEDDDGVRELFTEILKMIFSDVITASNGDEGFRCFQEHHPDIVMTDIYMPMMDGIEMAKKIKKCDSSVPIIVTSAYSQPDEFLRSIEIGIDGYVVKPFTKDRLFGALDRILEMLMVSRKIKMYNRLVENIISHVADGIVVTDTFTEIVMVNPAFCEMIGYEAEELIGQKPSFYKSHTYDSSFYASMWNQIMTEGEWKGEVVNRRKDGSLVIVFLTIMALKEGGETIRYIGTCRDITREKSFMDEASYKAIHDSLTGVYNRQYLESLALDGDVHPYALMVIDLDGFKAVNDTYGHATGDKVLLEVAKGLEECVRKSDVVIRYGGDEFVVVLMGVKDPQLVEIISKRMLGFVRQLGVTMFSEESIGVSIGIEFSGEHGKNFLDVYENADKAMYEVKKKGKNSFALASNKGA